MARRPAAPKKTTSAQTAPPAKAKTPPARLFAVTLSRGPGWDNALAMEQQPGWEAHAEFMDGLEAEGFIFIGGPLDETPYVLHAVRAENPTEVRTRLEADPWQADRLLEITRIASWTLKLGSAKV
jgi:uncharacterized protein YciI